METSTSSKHAVIVGAGPVGCLTAIMLASQGWQVSVYEVRPDMRIASNISRSQQRSINLAISHRGIAAISALDPSAAEEILQHAIPMAGRMIHHLSGTLESQLYDRDGQCINSIDRAVLNKLLLERAGSSQSVRLFFQHKTQYVDFDDKIMTVQDLARGKSIQVPFDLCIGSDGSYSIVRRQMMKVVRMDYQQEYLRDEYVELRMRAGKNAQGEPTFLIDPNHLHIWPRHSFMLIALPNKDRTFTCTLFAPKSELDRLRTPETIREWFKSNFPDALGLIGEDTIVSDMLNNPRSGLMCTKSNPYHYKDRGIVLGDAAHSMVPFYGQGLNCGLEDVRVLGILLRNAGVESTTTESLNGAIDAALATALEQYSCTRHQDLLAISDLAMNNYAEMRHFVATPLYLFKKRLDDILYRISYRQTRSLSAFSGFLSRFLYVPREPSNWLPLYTMVTFRPDLNYAMVRRKAARQSLILSTVGWIGIALLGTTAIWVTRAARAGRLQVTSR